MFCIHKFKENLHIVRKIPNILIYATIWMYNIKKIEWKGRFLRKIYFQNCKIIFLKHNSFHFRPKITWNFEDPVKINILV